MASPVLMQADLKVRLYARLDAVFTADLRGGVYDIRRPARKEKHVAVDMLQL
jgi:hypothetical protein